MITYQVEAWGDFWPEASQIWDAHWEEVALDKEHIKLNLDMGSYDAYDAVGALHVVTVRSDGELIGYHVTVVRPHLHYVQSLSGFTDVYYVKPEHRKGLIGYRLFQYVEKTLKQKGVERLFTGTKLHLDMGKLFERLGWTEVERLYTKYIKE